MKNVLVVSSVEFHVLSNGALVTAVVGLILCKGKWIKLFTETELACNLLFQHIGLNLSENQVHCPKER
jgi:hypothetical protein